MTRARSLPLVRFALASPFLASWLATARASTIFGNPVLSVALASGSPVELLGVRGQTCPGHVDDAVQATLAVGSPLTAELPADDYCGLAVAVVWEENESPDLVPVEGVDELTLASSQPTRVVTLDPSSRTASLQ